MKKFYPIEAFSCFFKSNIRLRPIIILTNGIGCFCINFVDFCHDSGKSKQASFSSHCSRSCFAPMEVPLRSN